uniref:C-type lectin domain-containing protein n=1 Tax=Gadus morhua TaxID=8049 RepID=A0A8C5CSB8_GADMO
MFTGGGVSVYSQCEPGWRPYQGRCYYFSVEPKSWNQAHASCLTLGGDLMSIQTYQERVRETLPEPLGENHPTGTAMWMGGHDSIVEGGWGWSDGSPFRYIHWSSGTTLLTHAGYTANGTLSWWNDLNYLRAKLSTLQSKNVLLQDKLM